MAQSHPPTGASEVTTINCACRQPPAVSLRGQECVGQFICRSCGSSGLTRSHCHRLAPLAQSRPSNCACQQPCGQFAWSGASVSCASCCLSVVAQVDETQSLPPTGLWHGHDHPTVLVSSHLRSVACGGCVGQLLSSSVGVAGSG
jgi:hypothetical protein